MTGTALADESGTSPLIDVAVVGGGPAGLFAAETAVSAGCRVMVFEAKPSVGRKFLVAGKGGMNLTHADPPERMAGRYTGTTQPDGFWSELLTTFPSSATREWARSLGQESFASSSGRVYLKALRSAPLLRQWIARLRASGVEFAIQHRWTGISASGNWQLEFANGRSYQAKSVVLGLGGASWPKTGSDGAWQEIFCSQGIHCLPLAAANCGWNHHWQREILPDIEGKPLKNLVVSAGNVSIAGELVITRHGLEGGPLYALGPTLRLMPIPRITIDLKPTFSADQLARKMESVRKDFVTAAAERWKLPEPARMIFSRQEWKDAASLAHAVKHWSLTLDGPRPIAEAISCAGGVDWKEIDAGTLMLKAMPGVFVAGEMIDWEAPTGGYLLQGCMATGFRAGNAAAAWAKQPPEKR